MYVILHEVNLRWLTQNLSKLNEVKLITRLKWKLQQNSIKCHTLQT